MAWTNDYSGNLNRFDHMFKDYDDKTNRFIYHDLKSEISNLIESQIRDVEIIYHLAASSHVDRSITDPLTFVKDNVLATANILNYARYMDKLDLMSISALTRFLDQLNPVSLSRNGIDTIVRTLIAQQKLVVKSWQ